MRRKLAQVKLSACIFVSLILGRQLRFESPVKTVGLQIEMDQSAAFLSVRSIF